MRRAFSPILCVLANNAALVGCAVPPLQYLAICPALAFTPAFAAPSHTRERTAYIAGSSVSGPVSCGRSVANLVIVGAGIAGIATKGLGLKCEDDGQSTWLCDDDAVYIGWASINPNHRNGIGKCGSDGGDGKLKAHLAIGREE